MSLQNFFNPRSIAIIGASADRNKVGYALMANLVAGKKNGRKRDIYPVSISEKEILGLKAYPSVRDIPDKIDLAVIAVRADIVPAILKECGEKKIDSAIIISAGFREIGKEGIKLEDKVIHVAEENGIAILGPNCLGIIDTVTDLNASFGARKPRRGKIAFLSQSGALGTSILDLSIKEGVGFSKFVSLGNEASLTEMEFLKYLADDDDTDAILIYLEKLSKGREFMHLAAEITRKKPIVVLKAGRSTRGAAAVMSHTGSLAPDNSIFSADLKQSGVVAVESIREFFDMAKLFQLGITQPLSKFVILTNGGGPSVVAADLVDLSKSLSLVKLSAATQNALRKVLPPMAAVGNPVDIIGDALSARYKAALDILVADKHTDGIILILTPQMMTEVEATAKLVSEYRSKMPIIPVFLGGPTIEGGLAYLHSKDMTNFDFPVDAIEALDGLALGAKKHDVQKVPTKLPAKSSAGRASKMMEFEMMKKLLGDYGVSLSGILVKGRVGLADAITKSGKGPFALKAISADIVHKTDKGAVQLNLKDLKDIETAWDKIMSKNPDAKLEGMLLQPMVSGKEVIIGMKEDLAFGPTILFGLGGIFTEALKDTSLRIAPISKATALEMIGEIKGIDILRGLRGEKGVDLGALADLLVKISKLSMDHPEVREIDLNPVMATENGVVVVDARVI